jgi:hypothetical protein
MIADGSGGVIIVWSESRTSGADIYAQRMSALGVPLWTTDGVLLCSNPSNKYYPVITRSAGQTWIIAWDDHRGPGGTDDIYAQCIDSSGSLLWSRDGVSLCTAPREQYRPQIAGDGNGGAIIVWTDNRNSPDSLNLTADLYAQRVGPSGTVQWATDGVAVTTAHNDQVNPVLGADDRGGAVIAWMDARSDTSYDIYAQRVAGSGLVDWAQDGIPVSTALHDQTSPCILDDGSGGAVVAWEDWRPWTNADIYGQHISHQGLLGPVTDIGPMENRVVQYELAQNYPNPFNPTTNIQYSLPKWSHVTIDIYNILGQKISTLVNEEQAPGQHTVTLNGTGLATGVYLCHMQAGPFAQTRKLLLLK